MVLSLTLPGDPQDPHLEEDHLHLAPDQNTDLNTYHNTDHDLIKVLVLIRIRILIMILITIMVLILIHQNGFISLFLTPFIGLEILTFSGMVSARQLTICLVQIV